MEANALNADATRAGMGVGVFFARNGSIVEKKVGSDKGGGVVVVFERHARNHFQSCSVFLLFFCYYCDYFYSKKTNGTRVVWCGVVWCGVVWCGVVWCGVV